MLILLIYLIQVVTSIVEMTILDRNEITALNLQTRFNHSLQYSEFSVVNGTPEPIQQYLSFRFPSIFQQVFKVQVVDTNNTFRLKDYQIYKIVSIFSQPIKIFLTSESLLVLIIFDEEITSKQSTAITPIYYINFTKELKKSKLNCTDMTIDSSKYFVYVECQTMQESFFLRNHYTMKVQLLRDFNLMVYKMEFKEFLETSAYLLLCRKRRIIYIPKSQINRVTISNSIMVYCPYSNHEPPSSFSSIIFSTNFNNRPPINIRNFQDCQQCDYTEQIIMNDEDLLLVSLLRIYSYSKSVLDTNPVVNLRNGSEVVRGIKLGSAQWVQDLYILTNCSLFVKYPRLTNIEKIEVIEKDEQDMKYMEAANFAVTENYIYIQFFPTNRSSSNQNQSIIKIYKLQKSYPKLIYKNRTSSKLVLIDAANYLELANYFYSFNTDTNFLNVEYYRGPTIQIQYNSSNPVLNTLYSCQVTNHNESLLLQLRVRNFNDTNYYIQSSKLLYQFEQNVVNINLRQYIDGPLIEFFLVKNSFMEFELINSLNLIDISKVFSKSDIQTKLVSIKFIPRSSMTFIEFYYKDQNNIIVYQCQISYNSHLSVYFDVQNCNAYLNRRINPVMNLTSLIEFQPIIQYESSEIDYYLLYNSYSIEVCSETSCHPITFLGVQSLNGALQIYDLILINRVYVSFDVLILTNNRKQLRLYQINIYLKDPTKLIISIGPDKIKDLQQPQVFIVDYQVDIGFGQLLAVQLSNSKIYVIQREIRPKSTNICHIAYVIDPIDTACDHFKQFFLVNWTNNIFKIVILCSKNNTSRLLEFTIFNSFDIQYTRQYPLYEYQVSDSITHYCDDTYIYIGATKNNVSYYLIFNCLEMGMNVLIYKIKLSNSKNPAHFVGNIDKSTIRAGIGIIENYIYAFSETRYLAKIGESVSENYSKNITFGVRNDKKLLTFVTFHISINLANSKISYTNSQQQNISFDQNSDDFQLQKFTLNLTQVTGPIEDIRIQLACDNMKLSKQDIIEPELCLSYFGKRLGKVRFFITLKYLEATQIVITDLCMMCIKNKKIKNRVANPNFMFVKQFFDNSTTNTTRLLLTYNVLSSYKIQLYTVNNACEFQMISDVPIDYSTQINYFDFQTLYPYVFFQVPILLPENKDYYICKYDEDLLRLSNCSLLMYQTRSNFLSTDYDIFDGYAIVLEDGVGIFQINIFISTGILTPVRWIKVQQLSDLNIFAPYTYIKVMEGTDEYVIMQIGTNFESYQIIVSTKFLFESLVRHIYHKYNNCYYDKSSKPQYYENYVVKVCELKPMDNYVVGNLIPIFKKQKRKYIQIFYKTGIESWPIRMDVVFVTQSFRITNGYLIANSLSNLICYYKLSKEAQWTIQYYSWKNDQLNCNSSITFYNQYYSTEYPLSIQITPKQKPDQGQKWAVHIIFGVLVLLLGVIYGYERILKKRDQNKKKPYTKHFYSNDFQNNLRRKLSTKVNI